jgi:hypothetical protein
MLVHNQQIYLYVYVRISVRLLILPRELWSNPCECFYYFCITGLDCSALPFWANRGVGELWLFLPSKKTFTYYIFLKETLSWSNLSYRVRIALRKFFFNGIECYGSICSFLVMQCNYLHGSSFFRLAGRYGLLKVMLCVPNTNGGMFLLSLILI